MGIRSNLTTAGRSLTRRKIKNISAILAIALGVTLMVGVQITTETLRETFLTSLLLSQGEVDITISSNSPGSRLSSEDLENISKLLPDAKGIMPTLGKKCPVLLGSQFEPHANLAGIPLEHPEVFGQFYDWETGEEMDIKDYLSDNNTVLLSSRLANSLDLDYDAIFPLTLQVGFTNISYVHKINETTHMPVYDNSTGIPLPVYDVNSTDILVEFNITGVYDSNRPGISSQYSKRILTRLDQLQQYLAVTIETFGLPTIRNTDLIDSYVVSFKADHFREEIDRDFLQNRLDELEEDIPERENPLTGKTEKVYQAQSARLFYVEILGFIFDMLNTFLTALGLLIVTTGLLLITNIQLMSVEDREFQTGVLRAVGEDQVGIFRSYLIETVLQGLIGGILGLFGGIAFGWGVAFYLASLFGTGQFSVTPVIQPYVVVLAVIVGVVIAVLTGILPSIRAANVNIVEALRGIKTQFEEKSSSNLLLLGLFLAFIGGIVLFLNWGTDLYIYLLGPFVNFILDFQFHNPIFDFVFGKNLWDWKAGFDSIIEWQNILLGAGLFFGGIGLALTHYIDRIKALNITAVALWSIPMFAFIIGFEWLEDVGGMAADVLIFAIIEIVVGSVLIVGLNLGPLMQTLRSILIRFNCLKGVAQVSPALISSHKLRSTLTFAIFGVILTLNVLVATLVATNFAGTVGQASEDSRGVDLFVNLNKPEITLSQTSYAKELLNLDDRIDDVIPFRTCDSVDGRLPNFVLTKDPTSESFDLMTDVLPLRYIEVEPEQIRGDAINASDEKWRYDYYLRLFPDEVREDYNIQDDDEQLLDLSRRSWDLFFDPTYRMTAYNVSGGFGGGMGGGMGGMGGIDPDTAIRDENGTLIKNPLVFTESFFLPLGMQIWVPMNTTEIFPGFVMTNYQPFTVGGRLDSRAGGFPLGVSGFGRSSSVMGSILIPKHWSNNTNFFGPNAIRDFDQYDAFLIKTSLPIDSPEVENIAQVIEDYTNTEGTGYQVFVPEATLIRASATTLYSGIEESIEIGNQMTSFLQIYVSFGLVIGAVGMAVISVRNVAERKREIGMMRAIGFPQSQVILSVLLELLVLGIIGLVIGVVNGLMLNIGFSNLQDVEMVIPWDTIAIYLGFITIVALIAGAIPGWTASRIPPSEALRYVG